jgi:hypothetical protein
MRRRLVPLLVGLAAFASACRQDSDLPTAAARHPTGPASRTLMLPSNVLGINIHFANPTTVAAVQDLGAGTGKLAIARIDFDWWDYVRKGDGVSGPGFYDDQATELSRAGIQVLATVGYRYAGPNDSGPHLPTGSDWQHCRDIAGDPAALSARTANACVPAGDAAPDTPPDNWDSFYTDWKAFVADIVSRYGDRIRYWGSWNEPTNNDWFFGEPWQLDSLAASLCRVVHADPRGLVCVGPEVGIRDGDVNGATVAADVSSLRAHAAAVAAAAPPGYDVISFHSYRPPAEVNAIATQIQAAVPNSNVWATETSELSPNVAQPAHDPELQEQGLFEQLNAFRGGQMSKVGAMFLFDLESPNSGLYRDGTGYKRPGYYAVKHMLLNSYQVPGPGFCTSSFGTPSPCDFLADTFSVNPFEYTALVEAHVIDQGGNPVPNSQLLLYRTAAQIGVKSTNVSGVATFTIDRADTNGHGVYFIGGPYVLAPKQRVAYDALRPAAGQKQIRWFMVARDSSCSMSAQVIDQNGVGVSGVTLMPYRADGRQFPFVTTGANGLTPQFTPAVCKFEHGFQLETQLLPSNVHLAAGQSSAIDGIFAATTTATDAPPPPANPRTVVFHVTR